VNAPPTCDDRRLRRIRGLTALFILALVLSGATAIPLETELDWLVEFTGARQALDTSAASAAPAWARWLTEVQTALHDTNARHPFLAYGTDWLAFGHFVIALAFVGALRDPVRNRWLFDFGLIACGLVVPYAFLFGALRGIPMGWRLMDCAFGVGGAIPLWLCRKWAGALGRSAAR